jgi:hypothetical protein
MQKISNTIFIICYPTKIKSLTNASWTIGPFVVFLIMKIQKVQQIHIQVDILKLNPCKQIFKFIYTITTILWKWSRNIGEYTTCPSWVTSLSSWFVSPSLWLFLHCEYLWPRGFTLALYFGISLYLEIKETF